MSLTPKKVTIHRPDMDKPLGLGDAVALIAKPVGKVIDAATSVLPEGLRTDFENCLGCHGAGGRQEKLNNLAPNINPFAKPEDPNARMD